MLSTESVATRLLAFWYMATAFLLLRLAPLGLKVILGGLKSLGIKFSSSNKSIESDMMNVVKVNQKK